MSFQNPPKCFSINKNLRFSFVIQYHHFIALKLLMNVSGHRWIESELPVQLKKVRLTVLLGVLLTFSFPNWFTRDHELFLSRIQLISFSRSSRIFFFNLVEALFHHFHENVQNPHETFMKLTRIADR